MCVALLRVALLTLVELQPNLDTQLSQKHAVHVDGYHKESTKLHFTGTPNGVLQARKEAEAHIACVCKSPLPSNLTPQLISSLVCYFTQERIKATICEEAETKYICCCSPDDLKRAKERVTKPYMNTLDMQEGLESVEVATLQEMCGSNRVRVSLKGKMITIEGFCRDDVQLSKQQLQSKLIKKTMAKEPLFCTSEQQLYLAHLLDKKVEGESIKQSLPASIFCSKDEIILIGTAQEREVTTKALLQRVPPHHRSVPFSCHMSIFFLAEKHILQQSSSVEWIRDEASATSKKGFRIALFSSQVEPLEAVYCRLQVRIIIIEIVTMYI